jgi:hypothetical protein
MVLTKVSQAAPPYQIFPAPALATLEQKF